MTFTEFLRTKERENTPVGEFARAAYIANLQRPAPRTAHPDRWVRYMGTFSPHIPSQAVQAMQRAAAEYIVANGGKQEDRIK